MNLGWKPLTFFPIPYNRHVYLQRFGQLPLTHSDCLAYGFDVVWCHSNADIITVAPGLRFALPCTITSRVAKRVIILRSVMQLRMQLGVVGLIAAVWSTS